MLLFLLVALIIFTACFLLFMSDADGWTEIKYFNYNWKVFLQDQNLLQRDMEYAKYKKEVYLVRKRKIESIKDKERLISITSDRVFSAVGEERNRIAFDFCSNSMSSTEVRKMALDIVRELGYPDAKEQEKYSCYTVEIYLEPRK